MNNKSGQFVCVVAALIAAPAVSTAQNRGPADHPNVTIGGQNYNPKVILGRNMGTPADQEMQFPPHKIIGNVYYIGSKTLSSFLIVTPAGNIVMDTTYERNVRPVIQKSVEDLGFKFSDTKFILGNHAHGDHMEGDALAKELSGAQVWVMAEDEAALRAMKPGGKEHPIDKVFHDGDTLSLGGTTLTAHLTPGHTHGCTTWTMKATDAGKTYDVVFHCSLRAGGRITPDIEAELNRSFPLVRALPCDVPLGDHGAQYDMQEKFAKLKAGAPNPFIDPKGCNIETDIEEAMFHAILKEQAEAAK